MRVLSTLQNEGEKNYIILSWNNLAALKNWSCTFKRSMYSIDRLHLSLSQTMFKTYGKWWVLSWWATTPNPFIHYKCCHLQLLHIFNLRAGKCIAHVARCLPLSHFCGVAVSYIKILRVNILIDSIANRCICLLFLVGIRKRQLIWHYAGNPSFCLKSPCTGKRSVLCFWLTSPVEVVCAGFYWLLPCSVVSANRIAFHSQNPLPATVC